MAAYRGFIPGSHGGNTSMPMPMHGVQSQPYPRQTTPYPNQTTAYPNQTTAYPNQTTAYPVPISVASTTEIDNALKQLTDDLVNSVIKSAQNEDLEGLINNDEKLNELIMDSQITKDLKKKREEMSGFNKDLAMTNLSLKPEMESLKTKLIELSVRQNELRDSYVNNRSKLGNTTSVDTIFAILQAAASEKETSSDQIKSDYYDGELSIDDFMKQFIEERKLYQLRKIKSEKMKLIVGNPVVSSATSYPTNHSIGYQVNHQHPPYPAHGGVPVRMPHAVPTSQPVLPPRSYYGGYNMR